MFAIPNQSSVPKAYEMFTSAENEETGGDGEGGSRMLRGGNRDRVVDCVEEFVKYTIVMREHFALFGDRYSERVVEVERAQAKILKEAEAVREARPEGKPEINGVNLAQV